MSTKVGLIFFWMLIVTLKVPIVSAGEGEWVVRYKVEDLRTKQLMLERDFESGTTTEYASIFAGAEYNVTIMVKIAMSVPYATLRLETNVDHSSLLDRYWEIHSSPPPTVESYNPNERYIEFNQEKGDLVVSLYGKIPEGITELRLDGGIVLHRAMAYVAVALKGPGSEILDSISFYVIDSKIDEYQNILKQKRDDLQRFKESRVVSAYIELFEKVITQAKGEAEQGFVDKAISLLNLLSTDEAPREHVPSWMETSFIPAILGLLAIVALLGVFSVRTKGKLDYILLVIEDQIRELEGLTLRVSKLDKNIHSSLESIKDKLKSSVGV